MTTAIITIRRKGKVVGRAKVATDGPLSMAALQAASKEAGRQAKADQVARNSGKKAYRKKR